MSVEPPNFFMKQNISLQDAIDDQKPIPPWKLKLMKDAEGTLRTPDMKIVEQPAPAAPVKKKRKWVQPFFVLLLLIEWLASAIVQIFEIIRKSFETLTLALESYMNEPDSIPPSS